MRDSCPAPRTHTGPITELSVVIPALESSAGLSSLLPALAGRAGEIRVVDGGSQDRAATAACAEKHGAGFMSAPRGRGTQLRAGCARSSGAWLLILHADSSLPATWADEVRAFIAVPEHVQRAACFRLAFDDGSWPARRTAFLANLRTRVLALPYGDQGLLISRALLDAVGGFRDVPIMEDVDIVRRIGRRRLRVLKGVIRTSADRYRRDGWLRRSLRNLWCLALWFGGVPPERILKNYEGKTAPGARPPPG